jgi:biopolymer transport protein TolR
MGSAVTRIPRGAKQFKWRRQRQENARRRPTLNLVALMDVFTILVFFFLVHSTDGAPEARGELVNLPESVADQQPRNTPLVTITRDIILLEGELVAGIDSSVQANRGPLKALLAALQTHVGSDATDNATEGTERELTIMADKSIPFELLNRVMRTCTQAGYGNISLSVLQRSTGAG